VADWQIEIIVLAVALAAFFGFLAWTDRGAK
jgi:hypothetical protein